MEPNDRDRMLLAFANLASHGIAARPAMASDAAGLAAELRARHPRGHGPPPTARRTHPTPIGPLPRALTAVALPPLGRPLHHPDLETSPAPDPG